MTAIIFIVPGPPVPWARARRMGNRYFVDGETERQKNAVSFAAKKAGAVVIEGPVHVTLEFRMPLVKGAKGFGAHTKRPDIDNLCKLVLDALNGTAWRDDGVVMSLSASKVYAPDGEEPRTRVEIRPLGQMLFLRERGWM